MKVNEIPAKFHNQVINGDVMETIRNLPTDSVDMIYADPDYNVGVNYAGQTFTKTWDEYVAWYSELIAESMRVMKPTGNLFTINYPRQNAYLRVKCLDDLAYDVHDYAWIFNTNVGHSKRRFTTAHRSILHATKSKNNAFYKNQVAQPYKNLNDARIKARMEKGDKGRMPYSWFYYDLVKNVSKDKTFHSCQIPLGLTELLIRASTKPKDSVLILFGGSGSEIVLAKKLKRTYISCEINQQYYEMILDRLNNNGRIRNAYKCLTRESHKTKTPKNTNEMINA